MDTKKARQLGLTVTILHYVTFVIVVTVLTFL